MKFLTLVAIVFSSAIATAQVNAEDPTTKAIIKVGTDLSAAFNRGDAAAMSLLYTENGKMLSPDVDPIVQGRQGIAQVWGSYASKLGNLKLTPVDIQVVAPDVVEEVGTFTMETKGDKPQKINGKYISLLRKVGGQWLIATDIFNYKAQ